MRARQFFYSIVESSGSSDDFAFTAVMKDDEGERRVTYQAKVVGDELQIAERRANSAGVAMVAHRFPEGEGALPARIPPPALHKVRDNGLARTPPMGWNSWNKFATRVDDATVRGIADAMARNGMQGGRLYLHQYRRHLGGRARRAGQYSFQHENSRT